ncbi:MAG: hypothetical protein OHK0039_03900 [Bacteroidia bacterium]
MFGQLRQYMRRILEVPVYTSSIDAQFALINLLISKGEWVQIARPHLLALLLQYVRDGLYPLPITPGEADEQARLLHLLGLLARGRPLDAQLFPFLHSEEQGRRLGRWLSNVLREDLAPFPRRADALAPVSVFAPEASVAGLRATLRSFDPVGGEAKLIDLARYVALFDLAFWHELLPYAMGPVWAVATAQIVPEDRVLLLRAPGYFAASPRLGLLRIASLTLVRASLIDQLIYPNMPIDQPIDALLHPDRIRRRGWEVQER